MNFFHVIFFIAITSNKGTASADIIAAEEGEDVVFMFNTSTNILAVTWGIRDGDTNNFKLGLIAARNISGEMKITITDNAGYSERVSFVGDLSKGQAWFKITNLNINDTNQYMARLSKEGGGDDYMFKKLIVKEQGTTTTVPTSTRLTQTGKTNKPQEPTTVSTKNPPILKSLKTFLSVDREFSPNMTKNDSLAFMEFAEEFRTVIKSAYNNSTQKKNFENVRVIHLREGSILVSFIVFFNTEIRKDQACSPIERAIKNGKLGSLKIVPDSLGCSNERPSSPRPPYARTGVHPGIIAGVAIVGVLAIAGLVITIIFVCRKKSSKKAYRSSSGPGYDMQTMHGEPEEQYASVQRTAATGATGSHDQPLPQYAAVDKSKKKKKPKDPNELIYAQLDHDYNASMGTRPPSDRRPTSGSDTVYADIQSDKQKQRHPPPQYGNMQDISHA